MRAGWLILGGLVAMPLLGGCALKQVDSKTKLGVEFRNKGRGAHRAGDERYSVQQGFAFKWKDGTSTGLTYRRRDVNEGPNGEGENGVWVDFTVPIWKAPKKPDAGAQRIDALESRLAQLEGEYRALLASRSSDALTTRSVADRR